MKNSYYYWKILKILIVNKIWENVIKYLNFDIHMTILRYTEKLFMPIFTIVFFNLGKNVSL